MIICIAGIVAFSNLNFKSVEEYKKEQEKIADSKIVADESGKAAIIFDNGVTVSEKEILEAVSDQIKDERDSEAGKDAGEQGSDGREDTGNQEKVGSQKNAGEQKNAAEQKYADERENAGAQKKSDKQKSAGNREDQSENEQKSGSNRKESAEQKNTYTDSQHDKDNTNTSEQESAENTKEKDNEEVWFSCSIEVVCYELSENPELMKESYRSYIPQNGVLIEKSEVKVLEGTTVYDVLNAACKINNVAIDSVYNPFYKTYYVKAIGNLYEKDAGDMSGWVYMINGQSPMLGASACKIKDKDVITWKYTIDGVM